MPHCPARVVPIYAKQLCRGAGPTCRVQQVRCRFERRRRKHPTCCRTPIVARFMHKLSFNLAGRKSRSRLCSAMGQCRIGVLPEPLVLESKPASPRGALIDPADE